MTLQELEAQERKLWDELCELSRKTGVDAKRAEWHEVRAELLKAKEQAEKEGQ